MPRNDPTDTGGLFIGLMSGYFRKVDAVVMRLMDGLMAIPAILLAIALVALTRASVTAVIVAITIPEFPRVVRLVRAVVLSVREAPYVEAAIAGGTPTVAVLIFDRDRSAPFRNQLFHAPLQQLLVLPALDQELPPLERPVGCDQQLLHVHRLHDEVEGAQLEALDRRPDLGRAGKDDHGRVLVEAPHRRHQLDAVHHGHLEVGDGQRRVGGLEDRQAFLAVARLQTLVAGGEVDLDEDFANLMVVVDDQDLTMVGGQGTFSGESVVATWFLPARLAA